VILMAADVTLKNGKIVIKVGNESYPTGETVGPDDTIDKIKTKIGKAIGQVAGKAPEVLNLQRKTAALAKKLHEMAQGKKKETPKEEKGKKKEEGKEIKKEKIQIEKATPTPKVVTITLSQSIIESTLKDVSKKPDKKIISKIQKLADSFENLEEYISKNSSAVTAAVFNELYTKTDFEMYLNYSASAENNKNFERILSHMTENKKLSANEKELLDVANSAIRSYLLHVAKNNDKFSKEMGSLDGMKEKGPMDGKLFLATLLYLRRKRNKDIQPLELKLPEKTLEERKVKYRL